jgi:hypothetical protein
MHATLAYLNAAARRNVRSTPRNRAFWKVMHSLLATREGVPQRREKLSRLHGTSHQVRAIAITSTAPTEF